MLQERIALRVRFVAVLLFAVLVNAPVAALASDAEPEVRLAQFLYELPIMPGMARERGEQTMMQNRAEGGYDDAIEVVILRAQEGMSLSAESIVAYYNNVFADQKGFRAWHKGNDVLSGTFMGPRLVTKGDAHVFSQGHVRFWLPAEGHFITFWIHHRRDFDFGNTVSLLDDIEMAFAAAAEQVGYRAEYYKAGGGSSDWPDYTLNECFVGQRELGIVFRETETVRSCMQSDRYLFRLSVFPTVAHAEQWRQRLLSKDQAMAPAWRRIRLNNFHFEPRTIRNVVVEYRRALMDPADEAFVVALGAELEKVAKTYTTAPAPGTQ